MGSWGYSPMSNDTSEDIRDDFEMKLKYKKSFHDATKEILLENEDILNDKDEMANLWLALAERQWQYGFENTQITEIVKEICLDGYGQDIWKEEGIKEYQKRMHTLQKFYNKIQIPKEKPKKIPKLIIRKAIFKKGDCLSVKLNNNYYACALVLDEDNSNIEYGYNTIVILSCYTKNIPTLDLFHDIPYLVHTLYKYNKGKVVMSGYDSTGFKKFKSQIVKIGNIDISPRNFIKPILGSYCGWILLIEQAQDEFKKEFVLQKRQVKGKK